MEHGPKFNIDAPPPNSLNLLQGFIERYQEDLDTLLDEIKFHTQQTGAPCVVDIEMFDDEELNELNALMPALGLQTVADTLHFVLEFHDKQEFLKAQQRSL